MPPGRSRSHHRRPSAPKLTSPTSGSILTTNTPLFVWEDRAGQRTLYLPDSDRQQQYVRQPGAGRSTAARCDDLPGQCRYPMAACSTGACALSTARAWRVRGARSGTSRYSRSRLRLCSAPTNPTTTATTTPAFTWNPVGGCGLVPASDRHDDQFCDPRPPGQHHRRRRTRCSMRCPTVSTTGACGR